MAKTKIVSKTAQKKDQATYRAIRFFLGGCGAEAFLLMLRNYYVNGTASQVTTWDGYIYPMALAGLIVAVLGVALLFTLGKTSAVKKEAGLWLAGIGAYVAVISVAVKFLYTTLLTPMIYLVPLAAILAILWCLFRVESALPITILGVSLFAIWIARITQYRSTVHLLVNVALVVYMVCLAGLCYVAKNIVAGKKKCPHCLLSTNSDPRGIYVASATSIVTCIVPLISVTASFYAMWAVAAVAFLMVMYYTVNEL